MKRIFILTIAFVLIAATIYAQCNVRASVPRDTVVCGDQVIINIFGKGQGPIVFQENFNSGSPTGWAFTQQATFTNPCSPNGVDGTTHIWMGSSSGVPRSLQTNPYNFSAATAGATICFDMLFATQGNNAPCEGPDEPDEGVYLQYRIGNGPWVTIHYFDPNGGNDPLLTNWNNWCFQLPPAALTNNVSIRWFQDNDSGADYDHWGIDNVQIYFNDPTFTISVASPANNTFFSFPQGSSGGDVAAVYPRQTTTYYVEMKNTNNVTCRDTLTVYVRQPNVVVNAGRDTTLCTGKCAVLSATAKVVRFPAKVITYRNIQPDTASLTSLGGIIAEGAAVNINVQTLNMQNVLPNSILSVCIDEVKMQGFGFGGFGVGGKDLEFYLVCPDGTKIKLMPNNSSTLVPGLLNYQTIFKNTCFVPTGPTVASAPDPKSGNFGTNQPFDNLVGCSANGLWTLEVKPASGLGGGSVITTGWSITFDDPEASYPANFFWNPTTNMTASNTLSPTVCPTANRTYVLTASDTANCVTVSDTVNVNVQSCCNFSVTASATQPTCGASDGSINLSVNPTGNYSFLWADGNTNASRNGLFAGSYTVSVTDLSNNCTKDTTIVLNNNSTLSLQLSNPVNPGCGQQNGSITVELSGGTAPYTVAITVNGNTQTLNVPVAATQVVGNLAAGSYTIVVTDFQQCQQTQSISLTNPNTPTVSSFNSTPETCAGNNDGTASISASGGTGNLTITWSNGASGNSISGLAAGNYGFTVTDQAGCQTTGSVTVANGNGCCTLQASAAATATTCGNSNGSIDVTITTAGAAPYRFSLSGANYQSGSSFSGLSGGNYTVYVLDDNNCGDTLAVTVGNSTNSLSLTFNTVEPGCAGANSGSVEAVVSGGNPTYSFAWSNASTANPITNLSAGTYTVTVTDGDGCTISQSTTLNAAQPFSISLGNDTTFCAGGNALLNAPSGFAQYLWSNGETTPSINVSNSNLYSLTVTNASGCTATASVAVTVNENPTVSLPNDTTVYDNNPVKLTAEITGNANGVFKWEPEEALSCNNCKNPIAKPADTVTYVVKYTDANGCVDSAAVTINVISGAKIFMPNAFTPNGDGNNDILQPKSIGVKDISWKIYNRWGELVFETNDIAIGWDGTFKGVSQPSGVYVYTMKVTFRNNTNNQYNGSVSLIR